jgi:hypothetical protein
LQDDCQTLPYQHLPSFSLLPHFPIPRINDPGQGSPVQKAIRDAALRRARRAFLRRGIYTLLYIVPLTTGASVGAPPRVLHRVVMYLTQYSRLTAMTLVPTRSGQMQEFLHCPLLAKRIMLDRVSPTRSSGHR